MNTEIINIIPRTKETIIAEVKATIEHVESTALLGAIRIGRCFEELKELIPHGGWYEYIEENTGYTPKKVERFMKIAGEYGNENTTLGSLFSKTTLMSDLSYTKALSLLTLPEEEVETFVENHDIKDMTVKELEAEIKALKEKNTDLEAAAQKALEERRKIEEDLDKAWAEMKSIEASGSGNQEELEAKEQEIQKLRADLEKNKEAQSKLKDKIAQSEADTQKKIEEALEKTEWETARKIDKARQEAREAVDKELDEARANIERLSKELAAAGNEDILKIKIKAEQLQMVFAEITETIGNLEEERQEKMTAFLKTILRSFLEGLEV